MVRLVWGFGGLGVGAAVSCVLVEGNSMEITCSASFDWYNYNYMKTTT